MSTISRMMDHLQVAEHGQTNTPTASPSVEGSRSPVPSEQQVFVMGSSLSLNEDEARSPTAATSAST